MNNLKSKAKDTVLILASLDDLHAQTVANVINSRLGASALIWDSSKLPLEDVASFELTDRCTGFQIKNSIGNIEFDSIRSVWWRRPKKFNFGNTIADLDVQEFCQRECDAFFKGAFEAIGIPLVNNPTSESVANRKPIQLRVAQRIGLVIPKTLMSNDPEKVQAFWEKLEGKCIYKAFTPPSWQMAETRVLTEVALKDLNKLCYAPIIVQEKIEKGRDIRVSVFKETVFAASLNTSVIGAELDWRLDLTTKWEKHILPDEISQKLILLLKMLGLHYGCFDLIQQPDGTYIFLEINPSGQFLFVEIDTNQPLTQSLVELLLDPEK